MLCKKCHFQSTNPYTNSNSKSVKFKDYWQKLQNITAAALMSRLSKAGILEMEMANKKYMTSKKNNVLI